MSCAPHGRESCIFADVAACSFVTIPAGAVMSFLAGLYRTAAWPTSCTRAPARSPRPPRHPPSPVSLAPLPLLLLRFFWSIYLPSLVVVVPLGAASAGAVRMLCALRVGAND